MEVERRLKISELRANWILAQEKARRLERAIQVLADLKLDDENAMTLAESIIEAPMAP